MMLKIMLVVSVANMMSINKDAGDAKLSMVMMMLLMVMMVMVNVATSSPRHTTAQALSVHFMRFRLVKDNHRQTIAWHLLFKSRALQMQTIIRAW